MDCIRDYLEDHPRSLRRDIIAALGISPNTAKHALADMRRHGELIVEPCDVNRNVRWYSMASEDELVETESIVAAAMRSLPELQRVWA